MKRNVAIKVGGVAIAGAVLLGVFVLARGTGDGKVQGDAAVDRQAFSASRSLAMTLVNDSPWTFGLAVDGGSDAIWVGDARPDSPPPLGWQSARLAPGARLSGTFDRDGDLLYVDWAVTLDVDGATALTFKVGTTGDTVNERLRPTGFLLAGAPGVGGSVDRVTVLCLNLDCASYRTIAQVIALDPLTVSVRSVRS